MDNFIFVVLQLKPYCMQKRIALPLLFIGLLLCGYASAQVKIGDNPQTIDPASVLELESTERVLVITRVDSIQMSNITPNRGALVYNTSADCVFYYNGTDWINLCGSEGAIAGFTTDPIVNDQATIVITPTPTGGNIEIAESSINSSQIIDGGINGVDIQNGSIGRGKLQNNSVDRTKLAENSVGPFAIDNDSIDLADFNNVTGFIRDTDLAVLEASVATNTADIAADGDTDASNEIQGLSLSGNQLLLSLGGGSVTLPTADGSDTNINAGNNVTISGTGTTATPYIINAADEVDGSITNELTDLNFNVTTNILSLTNGATVPGSSVDLSSLAGGGGGGDDNQTAAEVPVAATPLNYTQTSPDVEGHLAGIDAALASGGGGGNQDLAQVLAQGSDGGASLIQNILNPVDDQDAATKSYVDGAIASGGVSLTDGNILVGDATDAAQSVAISGDATMDNAGVLTIENDAVDSDKIADATIGLVDFNQMGATDGQSLKWDDATTSWIVASGNSHTGATNSIFFADDIDGSPTFADGELFWDPTVRQQNGGSFGALGIGLDGGVMSTQVKVHIAEQLDGNLAYPLELQNRTNQNGNESATGLLFSVDLTNAHGKGALAYERKEAWGVGDFHFLQNTVPTATNPTLADKSFTITSNKDIQLYGDLIAKSGAATAVGQVLTNTATGTEWADPSGGGGGTDDQNSSEVPYDNATSGLAATDAQAAIDELVDVGNTTNGAIQTAISGLQSSIDNLSGSEISYDNATSGLTATDAQAAIDELAAVANSDDQQLTLEPGNLLTLEDGGPALNLTPFLDDQNSAEVTYDNSVSGLAAGTAQAAIDELAAMSGGENLENTNLVQTGLLRTFEVPENASLVFTGLGSLGIGNGANPPQQKFHVDGEIRATGYNSSGGTENEPAYAFSTGDDSNTGMYRPAADQIGFSVGGIQALRIEEPSIGVNKVVINQSLELDGPIIDYNDATGAPGNILTVNAAGTGVEWSVSTGSSGIDADPLKFTGDGGATQLSIATDAIGTAELATNAVVTTNIANETILSEDIANGTIEAEDLNVDSVGEFELIDRAVTSTKIGLGAILDEHINGGINGAKIDPDFGVSPIFTTGNIDGGSITATGDIAAAGQLSVGGNLDVGGTVTVAGILEHPDYVFQKYYLGSSVLKSDYHFKTLEEIEIFIKTHHHLPGIKSAETVKKEGVWDLGASNLQNLEKIEELFLHTIEQEKKIDQLQSEKEVLSDEVKALRKDLDEIKAMVKKLE